MKDEIVKTIHCSLMGMGRDHICHRFNEKNCKLCQLKNMYNNMYSLIVNMVDNTYVKEPGVEGLFIVLQPRVGLKVKHRNYVNSKLLELFTIRELICEIEDCKH